MQRISQYKYPELWRGCVGAWCPSRDQRRGSLILTDQSGKQNHGVLTNMDPAADWVQSEGKTAIDFDGANDQIVVPDNTGLSIEKTVSAWVYYTGTSTLKYVVTKNNMFWLAISATDKPYFRFVGSISDTFIEGATTVTKNQWIHLSGRHSSNGGLDVFLNGRLDGSTFISGAGGTTTTINIGRRNGGSDSFVGMIDDVIVHNRTLSNQEIKLLGYDPRRRGIQYEINPIKVTRFGSVVGAVGRSRNYLVGAY